MILKTKTKIGAFLKRRENRILDLLSCRKARSFLLTILFGFILGVAFLASAKTAEASSFISKWDTRITFLGDEHWHSSNNNQIKLPLTADGTYNFTVQWGDGNSDVITSYDQAESTHTYSSGGIYTVTIDGTISGFNFIAAGWDIYGHSLDPWVDDHDKILEISQWGDLAWGRAMESGGYFYKTSNLNITATDAPNLSGATNLRGTFALSGITTIPGIDNWNVSAVTDMNFMFEGTAFNQDIGDWNVSNVGSMSEMFEDCSFGSDISDWDVSNVTDMSYMFYGNASTGPSIGGWNVSRVQDMEDMFENSAFNSDISGWDVSSVKNMSSMFENDSVFNQNLSSWTVSSVSNMVGMFSNTQFNQNISGWDVSSVINMGGMFANTPFNQDIGDWDVSNVGAMNGMFQNTPFNQDISGWDVSSAENMSVMFMNDATFNQDISSWDVSNVTDMGGMFYHDYSFNQDLGNWDVSNVISMDQMFTGDTLSTANYNSLLVGWASLPSLQSDVNFDAGNSFYTLGIPGDARQSLIDDHGWTISDAGGKDFNFDLENYIKSTSSGKSELVFYNTDEIPTNGKIELTINKKFSADDISNLSSHITSFTANGSDISIASSSLSDKKISITIGKTIDAGSEVAINFDNQTIDTNPSIKGAYAFTLKTYNSSDILLEEKSANVDIFNYLYYIDMDSNKLYKINPFTLKNVSNIGLTVASGGDIEGGNGAAVDPKTNEVYAVLRLSSPSGTYLARVDMNTHKAEIVGNLIDNIISIAFDKNGQLYGLAPNDNPGDPSSLFKINKADATKILFASYDNPDAEDETVVYNFEDNKLYHSVGDSLYKIDLTDPDNPETVYENNSDIAGSTALVHLNGNDFYSVSYYDAYKLNTSSVKESYIDSFDAETRGLFDWDPIGTHTLTYTAGSNGSINGTSPQIVNDGDDGEAVEAVPDGGYHFVKWSDNSTDNPRTDTDVTDDIDVTAQFEVNSSLSFISTWDTTKISAGSSNSNQIKLPLTSDGTYNFTVQWGDGNSDIITAYDQAEVTHTYSSSGTYTITIDGTIEGFEFNNTGDKLKITKISQWGSLNLGDAGHYFQGTSNLRITATDILNLTGTDYLAYAFANSGITTVPNMNDWDVSNVTVMNYMFAGASSFNQNIGSWKVFNVNDMSNMFDGATSFNQNINNWDVSGVSDMYGMFQNATSFDQPIGNWDVSSAYETTSMFAGATSFNQDISNWNVSSNTDTSWMFSGATSFNQDLGSWNVSNVNNMASMFSNATSFDQDLGNWNISNVSDMSNMFQAVTLSPTNYNNLLTGWSALSSLQSDVVFDGGNSQYNSGAPADARQSLIDDHGWEITDGGMIGSTPNYEGDHSHVNVDINATISISCSDSANLNSIIGTGQSTLNSNNEASCNVITNNSDGYKLDWSASKADMEDINSDTIGAYTPASTNTPETWNVNANDSEWGARLKSTSTDADTSTWGATDTYAGGKWLNVDISNYEIVERSTETDPAGSSEILQFGAEIGANKLQPTGTYTVSVTITAVTL